MTGRRQNDRMLALSRESKYNLCMRKVEGWTPLSCVWWRTITLCLHSTTRRSDVYGRGYRRCRRRERRRLYYHWPLRRRAVAIFVQKNEDVYSDTSRKRSAPHHVIDDRTGAGMPTVLYGGCQYTYEPSDNRVIKAWIIT